MTRIVYYTATTLDGFIADPRDSLDWLLRQPQDESAPNHYEEFFANIGALVLGSTTYEWVLGHESGAWPYRLPAWVMTSRDLALPDRFGTGGREDAGRDGSAADPEVPVPDRFDIRFAQGPVEDLHAEQCAAAGGKDLWVVGGGDLAGQYAEAGLLDEVITSIAPVTLGAGRPLLPRRLDLELLEVGRNGSFVTARHRVVGPLAEDRR